MKTYWKYIIFGIGGFLLLLIGFMVLLAIKAPKKFWKELDAQIVQKAENQSFWQAPAEKTAGFAFVKARNEIMKADSSSLVIQVNDTLLWMELKGIPFHEVEIAQFRLPSALRKLDAPRILALFGSPADVLERTGTITREPITVIQAPKDTIEAAQNTFMPDTTQIEETHFSLMLSNGIQLVVTGWDEAHPALKRGRFKAGQHFAYLKKLLKAGITGNTLPYHPVIHLTIPTREAKVIYRALPEKPKIVIHAPLG